MMAANVATGLEIEGEESIRPVTWEEWITLPIRAQDNAVHTVRGPIRVPTVTNPQRDPDRSSRAFLNTGGNSGNQVGSFQTGAFQSHTRTGLIYGGQELASGGSGSRLSVGNVSTTGGNETRPVNAYVNYIVKY